VLKLASELVHDIFLLRFVIVGEKYKPTTVQNLVSIIELGTENKTSILIV